MALLELLLLKVSAGIKAKGFGINPSNSGGVSKYTLNNPIKATGTGSAGSVSFGTGSSSKGQFQSHLLENY